jgi:hypothetical protein
MFRPFRSHLQADIWYILGTKEIMCEREILLIFLVAPCINNYQTLYYPSNAHNLYKIVGLLKQLKV